VSSRRRFPPEIEEQLRVLAGRAVQELKNSLARASSEMFQSLARDAKRVPEAVRGEAVKAEGIIESFIASISNEEISPPSRDTVPETPRAKKAKRKRKKKSPKPGAPK
jgi:hypothetical protein